MFAHTDLKKGLRIVLEGEPYEVLEARPLKKAQRRVVIQSRVRNLVTGNVFERTFHQGNVFEEADLSKFEAEFLYFHQDRYFFCEKGNHSKRFDLRGEQIGPQVKFMKPNQIVEAVIFKEKIINISLPIKVQLKVIEAPPGVQGDRAQGGTKTITLETDARINAPLFVEQGNIVEVNTESGEYVRRIDEKYEGV